MELLSIRKYAAHRGCHPSYIGKMTKSGKIPLVSGKIDPTAADAILDQTTRPRVRSTGHTAAVRSVRSEGQVSPYLQARTVHETYRAKKEKLEYERMTEKLVEVDKVMQVAETMFSTVRVRLRGLARSMAPILAANSHPAEVERMLADAIDAALEELSTEKIKVLSTEGSK